MPNAAKTSPRGSEPGALPRRGGAPASADIREEPAPSEWRRIVTSRWLIGAVLVAFLLEAAILSWFRMRTAPVDVSLPKEVPLGVFEFTRASGRDKRVDRGQFDLFVRLTDDLPAADQRRFAQHQPQLQRAVEEALLRLRAADFADPRLARLKNRIQERLNDELGFDGVAEVLVSNFTIEPKLAPVASPEAPRVSAKE